MLHKVELHLSNIFFGSNAADKHEEHHRPAFCLQNNF